MSSKCPFCQSQLIDSTVLCPDNIKLTCQECTNCHSYFYSRNNYMKLRDYALKENHKLSSNVHYFAESIFKEKQPKKIVNNRNKVKQKPNKKNNKKNNTKKQSTSKHSLNTVTGLSIEKIAPDKSHKIDKESVDNCTYNKRGFCTFIDDNCNPYSIKCINIFRYKIPKNKSRKIELTVKINNHKLEEKVITAIVLSDNRKCMQPNHKLFDVIAKVCLADLKGKVILSSVKSAYCDTCNTYFVLKEDFKQLKLKGVLLCSVEDKTTHYLLTHKNQKYNTIGESRIHKMGYNVRKDYGYTEVQRHIILANIIENTDISQHEILSIIDADVARHKNKSTHRQAVKKWMSDREFVSKYKTGDLPEVLIDNIILKYNLLS